MKTRHFFSFLCFIICANLIFAACEPIDKVIEFFADHGTGYIFKIALPDDPETLDPQLANDENSIKICKNLYAGLMEYDESGRLTGCMADDYTISPDGLTYTFELKEGFKWHALGNYEFPVTADDFVFGFRRLMDPDTASLHSEKYFCIKNSQKVRAGEMQPEELGVQALDSCTLKFTLEYPNAEFLYLLAELPAMPCCEDFFITAGGKYGLEAEAVCSNGPFFVRYWLHDPYGSSNYVRLRRNPGYSDADYVSAGGINYLITSDSEARENDYNSGSTDVIVYPAGEYAKIDGDEYLFGSSATVGIVFNEKNSVFKSADVRQVFSWAIDRDLLNSTVPEVLESASKIVPDSGSVYLKGYSSDVPEEVGVTNLSMAEYKWSFLLTEREKSSLIGMSIMVPDDFGYRDCLSSISDCWYDTFGAHISIETVNRRDYDERIKSGDYDIAVAILKSDGSGVGGFLKPFGSEKKYGITVPEVVKSESMTGKYETLPKMNFDFSEGEKAILSKYHFIPLWHLPSVCVFDDDNTALKFDAFTDTVYFKDAKHF